MGGSGERRLPQVGSVRPAARHSPVPPGESRTIVTSIGVVGHGGEVREIALSSSRRQKVLSGTGVSFTGTGVSTQKSVLWWEEGGGVSQCSSEPE